MLDIKEAARYIIRKDSDLIGALKQLNMNAGGTLAVVDERIRLLGTVTDGDIRRAILDGKALSDPVTSAMKATPMAASEETGAKERLAFMMAHNITFLPVTAQDGTLRGAEVRSAVPVRPQLPNYAVIMCGGLGTRLGDLTRNCPKPMLRIGGEPILERIVKKLRSHGISRFFFATNYLREQIEDYFEDGGRWNVEITYLKEKMRLGTGGALSLLPFIPENLSSQN